MLQTFTIENKNGLQATLTNYGAILLSLRVPDKNGKLEDIVLGFKNAADYPELNSPYFGAMVGRYCNRIAKGAFELDGVVYDLAINNGPNHLHGGIKGFSSVYWDAKQIDTQTMAFSYLSKDMEEGYPGNLEVKVIYCLKDDNELSIECFAGTDKKTIVNLTHHSYFNLRGEGNGNTLDHELVINADHYTPVDENLIPSGEISPVANTPFDFTHPKTIGARIGEDHPQLVLGNGYDHNFVLNKEGKEISLAATVFEKTSGRFMEVYTNEPGLQFYSANWPPDSPGKCGKVYQPQDAFCLETQHFPDSPNKPEFPSVVLEPGEQYYSCCNFRFSVK